MSMIPEMLESGQMPLKRSAVKLHGLALAVLTFQTLGTSYPICEPRFPDLIMKDVRNHLLRYWHLSAIRAEWYLACVRPCTL